MLGRVAPYARVTSAEAGVLKPDGCGCHGEDPNSNGDFDQNLTKAGFSLPG